MPLYVVTQDIADVTGDADLRRDKRQEAFDSFVYIPVDIGLRTVRTRRIDQKKLPVIRTAFLFRRFLTDFGCSEISLSAGASEIFSGSAVAAFSVQVPFPSVPYPFHTGGYRSSSFL